MPKCWYSFKSLTVNYVLHDIKELGMLIVTVDATLNTYTKQREPDLTGLLLHLYVKLKACWYNYSWPALKYHMFVMSGPPIYKTVDTTSPRMHCNSNMPRLARPPAPSPHFIVHPRSEVNSAYHF